MNLVGDIMNLKQINILGAGFSCVDIIKFGDCEKIMLGGTAANVISVLSMFGIKSTFLQADYMDGWGKWLNKEFYNRGVDLEFFIKTKAATPRIIEVLDIEYRKHYFETTCSMCGKKINQTQLPSENNVQNVNLSNYNLFFYDRISDGIKKIASNILNGWSFYEPNSCRTYQTFLNGLKTANIVKFSSDRVHSSYIEKLLNDLVESNVQLVIVSMSDKGIKFSYRNNKNVLSNWQHIEPIKINNIIDTSGAGDWLTASFLYWFLQKYPNYCEILEKSDIYNMLIKAQEMVAFTCNFIGAQGIIEDKDGVGLFNNMFGLKINALKSEENIFITSCSNCKNVK